MNLQQLASHRKALVGSRHLMGLIFIVFGLNGFLNFLPVPPMPEGATNLIMAMYTSGYLLQLVKLMEVICGVMLMAGFCVPLALVLLAPIVVNIFLFHAFLAPQGLALPVVLVILMSFLGYAYRDRFAPLFSKV